MGYGVHLFYRSYIKQETVSISNSSSKTGRMAPSLILWHQLVAYTEMNAGAKLQTFPWSKLSKLFLHSELLSGNLTFTTLPFKSTKEKHTNENLTFSPPPSGGKVRFSFVPFWWIGWWHGTVVERRSLAGELYTGISSGPNAR